jgi:phage-related protein
MKPDPVEWIRWAHVRGAAVIRSDDRNPTAIADWHRFDLWIYTYTDIMQMSSKPAPELRPVVWLAGTKKDLMALPAAVKDTFGYALHLAQTGKRHKQAKPLHGFGSAGVLEIVEDWRGNAYGAVYTVRFAVAVYVLHVFQKKATRGIETPRHDMELIRERLKTAERIVKELSR